MLQRPATLSVLCDRDEVELVRVLDAETHSRYAEMGLEGGDTTSCPIMNSLVSNLGGDCQLKAITADRNLMERKHVSSNLSFIVL